MFVSSTPVDSKVKSSYDVVVLGGGLAGLSTAATLAEAGLSVVVFEKTSKLGGSTVMSGGYFAFSETEEQAAAGIQDSKESFRNDLVQVGGSYSDPRLIQAYLDNQDEAYIWLRRLGVEFSQVELSSGQSHARSHLSSITEVVALLEKRIAELGGHIVTNTGATELIQGSSGRVEGVVVEDNDSSLRILGTRGVVLATGGFSRGRDLLKVFAPKQLAAIPYGGLGNTGDGIKMGWHLGAGLADMGFVSGTYGSHPETGIEFHELLTAYYLGAIIVNAAGQRFVDESQSYKTLGAATLEQPEGLGHQIFDSNIRSKSQAGVPLNDMDLLESIGHIHKADTLTELAEAAGIDAGGLVETVEKYNAAISNEIADELGRDALCNGVGKLKKITEAPFYAYPAKTLMTTTYCGLTTLPSGQVTRIDDSRIPGLYAAGELVGGFHGQAYMTGTSLGKAVIFARIIGRDILDNQNP